MFSALDTVPAAYGSLTPTLSGGNLVITDSDATGKNNSLTISNNGLAGPLAAIVITDANEAFASTGGIAGATLSNGGKTLTVPLSSITGTQVIINGGAGNDTLTAAVANALGKILTFNGDDPATGTGDKLVVTGGTHATGTLNHTNKSDGSVVLGANTINYTGLEPVDITGTTITNLVINLPDNAGTPDDTELSLTGGGTILTVTSLNASHETDNIALAAFATVTVNARNGNDTIRIDSTMSTFNKALTLNGGSGDDTFVFETSLAAPGSITVNGNPGNDTLDYSGYQVAGVDTAVDVTLTAPGGNGYSGNVKVGANTITSFTEIDSVIGNSNTTTDSLTGLNSGATWNINEPALSTYSTGNPLGFQNLEKLTGGTNFDHFTINNTGAVAFTLAGGAGTDHLNVDPLGAATVTLTGDGTPAGFDGTFGTSNFTSLDTFYGAPSATLVGDDVNATWTILDGGASTYVTATRSASFGGFGNLQGSTGQDTFDVVNNSLTANYSLKGGAGLDAFNFGNANNLANITQPVSVDGEDDGATLTLNDQGTNTNINYSISATTIGRTGSGTVTFDDITDLTVNGTTGANVFELSAAPTTTGAVVLDGNGGTDTLNLTGISNASVHLTALGTTDGFDGIETTESLTFRDINAINGSGGTADSLKGLNAKSTWTIDEATTSVYDSTRQLNFTKFETLTGQAAEDKFVMKDTGAANYTIGAAASTDTLDFSTYTVAGVDTSVEVKLTAAANNFNGEVSKTTGGGAFLTFTDVTNFIGNTAKTDDRLTNGLNTNSTWTLDNTVDVTNPTGRKNTYVDNVSTKAARFAGFEVLNGGSANDIFTATNLGGIAYTVDGNGGSDTVNLTSVTNSKVELTNIGTTDGFDGNETTQSLAFRDINAINASSGTTDSLKGINALATWSVNEPASSTYNSTNSLAFSKFEQLLGNDGDDTLTVTALGSVNVIDGSAGSDTLNLTGLANSSVALTSTAADGFNGTVGALSFKQMNAVNGGTGTNSLKGLNTPSEWTIDETSATASKYKTTAAANEITFSKFQTLTGQAAEDRFFVNNTGATVYTINAGASDDTLDFTGYTGPVEITLAAVANNFNGTVKAPPAGPVVINFTDVTNFIGSAGAGDKLNGLNATSAWTIDATADAAAGNTTGRKNTYVSTKTARFNQIETLSGGSGNDTFNVLDNDPAGQYTLLGNAGTDKFNIGAPGDTLTGLLKLNVEGGGNTDDELTLNDKGTAGAVNYDISATNFQASTGLEVTHKTLEKITLNASAGANTITVLDGAYSPATTVKINDTAGPSTLTVDDTADLGNNTWNITSSAVTRTAPTPTLTVDYSGQATITKLSLLGGQAIDDITVTSTKNGGLSTTVNGGAANDKITVTPAGNLNALLGSLTVVGGGNTAGDTRTVFKGGTPDSPTIYKFTAKSSVVEKGDTLIINDANQAGFTTYTIDNASVNRTSVSPVTVKYSEIEFLKLTGGSGNSDITANMPLLAATQLPTVVQIDGGGSTMDNRFQIKGSTDGDEITVGDATTNEASRSQFEVASIKRMWVEGRFGKDTIHNRTAAVPALLDGGQAKDATTTPALRNTAGANENDVIISDAQSNFELSSVLLGNDGLDFLLTRNNNTNGAILPTLPRMTSFLIGDYFINTNVPFTSTNTLQRTNRLQIVNNPAGAPGLQNGETGDRYITDHGSATTTRNYAIARLDTNANAYGPGKFENLGVDATNLQVIQWLQGRLRITVSPAGIADLLAVANYYVRQFTREPGSPTTQSPAFPNVTYRPGGSPTTTTASANGGEFLDETATEPAAIVQNPFDSADVNGDGKITAFDALLIINELNLKGPHLIDTSATAAADDSEASASTNLLDVNGDSAVTAFDALLVINRLNMGDTAGQNPDALLNYFVELDELELATNEAFARELANNPPADSLSDDALLALLAADADDSDDNDDVLSL